MSSDRRLNHHVALTVEAELFGIVRRRLDMHATPALVVECDTDGVKYRILSTDIDKEAALDMLEGTPEDNVFKILGV